MSAASNADEGVGGFSVRVGMRELRIDATRLKVAHDVGTQFVRIRGVKFQAIFLTVCIASLL